QLHPKDTQARDTGEAELPLAVVRQRAEGAEHHGAKQRARAGVAVAYTFRNVSGAPSKRGAHENNLHILQNFKSAPAISSANANWPQRCASSNPLIVVHWKKPVVVRKLRGKQQSRDNAPSTKACATKPGRTSPKTARLVRTSMFAKPQ